MSTGRTKFAGTALHVPRRVRALCLRVGGTWTALDAADTRLAWKASDLGLLTGKGPTVESTRWCLSIYGAELLGAETAT